jgi:D-alanyl-D-alanine carboxypeptidase/D-alanyl-D-alanine-endopeptidase (penicillin-binding protein 4)
VRWIICITVASVFVCAPAAHASVDPTIERWLAGSPFAGRHTSLAVWDRTAGRLLAAHQVNRQLRPASNMKLLTSAAVLQRFGVGTRLQTRVFASGTLAAGTLDGSLWLVGGGDPSLATNTFSVNAWHGASGRLSELAAAVRAAGIRRVTGRLYGDESAFDSRRTAPFWKPIYWRDCPPLTALSVNEGLFEFGHPRASSDPPLYAAQLFVKSLRVRGVRFAHGPTTGRRPATARLVARELSPPLTRLVHNMDQVSDNFFAEVLTKDLAVHGGRAGTTANGIRAIRDAAADLGAPLRGARFYDGSGLSLGDRLSAANVLRMLRRAGSQRWGWYYQHALPLAGVSGTLRDRMRSGPAHGNVLAKTGTLPDASALSGYVTAANGHRLAFAILMNHKRMNLTIAHRIQDRIAQLLAASRP